MKHASQQRTAGVGMAAGALFLGSALWLSCQPGELPCDRSVEWQAVCDQAAGGVGGDPGPTGAGGAGGAAPASPPPGSGGMPTAATVVQNCAQWPTLGDMDRFFANRCGAGGTGTCHNMSTAGIWNDMFSKDVWKRLQTEGGKSSCKGAKLINTEKWSESLVLAKVQPGTPVCPPGSMPGAMPGIAMPPQMGFEPKMALLNADEMKCLENYLKAIAGK